MSNAELPEHRQLAEDLRRAKAKRVEAQQKMFATPPPGGCMGVTTTPAWLKASERERELASALAQLRYDSQVQLSEMAQAANAGGKWDDRQAQQLKTVIAEVWNDMMTI